MIGGSICSSLRRGLRSPCWLVALAVLLLLGGVLPASAQGVDDLCVVRVKKDDLGPGEAGSPHRLARGVRMMPGLDWLLLYRYQSTPSIWRIDNTRTLVPMEGEWPKQFGSLFMRFAAGDVPGRVIGLDSDGIYSLDPGTFVFRSIASYPRRSGKFFTDILRVERLRLTFVGGTEGLFVVEGDELRPLGAGTTQPTIGLVDLPFFGGIAGVGTDGGLHIRWDDGRVERVLEGDQDPPSRLRELPGHSKIVVLSQRRAAIVTVDGSPAERRVGRVEIAWSTDPRRHKSDVRQLITSGGGYLLKPTLGPGPLMRLGSNGLEVVPGARFAMGSMDYMRELSSIGLVQIQATDGTYIYDGISVVRLATETVGLSKLRWVADWPSVGLSFDFGLDGGVQILRDKTLRRLDLPFASDNGSPRQAEMAASQVGILFASRGVFGVGRDGVVRAIRGGADIEYGWPEFPSGVVSATGDLLFSDKKGLYMIIDRRRATDVLCD